MTFTVLRVDHPDAGAWQAVLRRFPPEARDLHYSPQYGLVYRDAYGFEPLLAVYEDRGQTIIQAIVRRALGSLAFLADVPAGNSYVDVATPYGYGGPLVLDPQGADLTEHMQAFDRAYRSWCEAERIASEFVCLHPLLDNLGAVAAGGTAVPVAEKQIVYIDLAPSEEILWGAISRGTRSSIRHARRAGVSVDRVHPDAAHLEAFQRLYLATMDRRGAAARWRFPPSYFAACVERLGPNGSALFFARCEGELAAAYLLLNDERTAYYHFGASDPRWFDRRPNNLLMFETMLWAKRKGLARYHLGGGVTANENDSLLRFKSSFGGCRALLYTYGRVLHAEVYRRLCDLKLEHERSTGLPVAHPDYFPLYRR